MADVFLSYAKEDKETARLLADSIAAEGWSVFWDRHIPSGQSWSEYISRALDESKCVVVLWTRTSIRSRWVLEEAEEAADKLIPVLVDPVRPPLGFRRMQAAPLRNWRGDRESDEFRDFVEILNAHLRDPGEHEEGEESVRDADAVRLRLTYDADGRGSRVELPFVIGVLGDWSARASDKLEFEDRQFTTVTRESFDAVMRAMRTQLMFRVEEILTAEVNQLTIELRFERLADFEPASVASQIGPLRGLLDGRANIVALQRMAQRGGPASTLLDRLCIDPELATAVAAVARERAREEAEAWSGDLDSSLHGKVEENEEAAEFVDQLRAALSNEHRNFDARDVEIVASLFADRSSGVSQGNLARSIEYQLAALDHLLGRQLDLVLHHPDFQALEARWCALARLVHSVPEDANIEIRILDYAQKDLMRSLQRTAGLEDTVLWREVVDGAMETFGASPFGLLIADYGLHHGPDDVFLMMKLSRLGEAAQVPVVAGARPEFFGVESIGEIKRIRNLALQLEGPEYTKWRSFRNDWPSSRFVSLTLSRFLCRQPYGQSGEACAEFDYEETCDAGHDYCWANASFLFAENAVRAFHRYGWCARIEGPTRGGLVDGLPRIPGDHAEGIRDVGPLEVALSSRSAQEICELGLKPLVPHAKAASAFFPSATSVQRARLEGGVDPADRTPQLAPLFAICRFAHYLRCMARDGVGGAASARELEFQLRNWLKPHVDPEASNDKDARHPLVDCNFKIQAADDGSGRQQGVLEIEPGYQLFGAEPVRVVFDLPWVVG